MCIHGSSSGYRVLSTYKALRETERERESSIYFRLPVPSRSGMIYAERVPRLCAAGEFSLSASHPAVSPGWRSVPLPSLSVPFLLPALFLSHSRGFLHRHENRNVSFLDDVQLPVVVPFFPSSLSNVSAGGRLIIDQRRLS